MTEVAPAAGLPQAAKPSSESAVAIEANAASTLESAAATGKVALTDKPKLGEPEAFFPANPAAVDELAQNKPVKQLKSGERTSSGNLLRTISDVITDLHKKHLDRKRVGTVMAAAVQVYAVHSSGSLAFLKPS